MRYFKTKKTDIYKEVWSENHCDKCDGIIENPNDGGSWRLDLGNKYVSWHDMLGTESNMELCESCAELARKLLEDAGFVFDKRDILKKD